MGGFVIRGVLCYMDVQLLLGCETAVVSFRACRNCFLKVGGCYVKVVLTLTKNKIGKYKNKILTFTFTFAWELGCVFLVSSNKKVLGLVLSS